MDNKKFLNIGQVLSFSTLFTADSLSLAQKLSGMPVLGNSIFICQSFNILFFRGKFERSEFRR